MKDVSTTLEELRFQLFKLEMKYESAKVAGGNEFAEFLTDYYEKRKYLLKEIKAKQNETPKDPKEDWCCEENFSL